MLHSARDPGFYFALLYVAPIPKVTSWSKIPAAAPATMSRFLLARGRKKRKNETPFQFKETLRIYDTFCWPKFNWKGGWKIQSLFRVAVCPAKTRRLYYLQKEETEFEGENSCHRRSIQDLMMHWTWGMRVAGVEVSRFFYQMSGCSCHSLKLDPKSPISHHSSLFPFPHPFQI